MKICIISDTHGKHKHLARLPEGDVIIHCGDMTTMGHGHEIREFMKWYSGLNQYSHRICCAGNHDRMLNVVHQRSDIAEWFVEGGSRALAQLSGSPAEA